MKNIKRKEECFIYNNIVDFSELIQSISETKYHNNEELNSLFHIRAINYIINGNSLIALFVHELINLIIKNYDEKKINRFRFKLKLLNQNKKDDICNCLYQCWYQKIKSEYDKMMISNPFYDEKFYKKKKLPLIRNENIENKLINLDNRNNTDKYNEDIKEGFIN